MSDETERAYTTGQRAVYLRLLRECLQWLGYNDEDIKLERMILEREEAIATLRDACGTYGDNDWPDSLHLSDIIDKHLVRYVEGK